MANRGLISRWDIFLVLTPPGSKISPRFGGYDKTAPAQTVGLTPPRLYDFARFKAPNATPAL
jgi:hypothetical protein